MATEKKNELTRELNRFERLNNIDISDSVKTKNGFSYAPWAVAYGRLKTIYPDATYKVYEDEIVKSIRWEDGTTIEERTYRIPWFTDPDNRSGWVKVGVTVEGMECIEIYPIMDFKNNPIPGDKITSTAVNKSIQRALTKAIARHGLGLFVYEGEDLPEDMRVQNEKAASCMAIIQKKGKIKGLAEKVAEICKQVLPEDCNGDPRLCEDTDTLKELEKKLKALR